MAIEMDEFEGLEDHKGRAFGASSKERTDIIKYLYDSGAATPAEVGEAVGIEPKLAKTRLDVMRRDGLVTWKDKDDEVFYGLTEKGKNRAEGKKEEPVPKKKKGKK